MLEVVHDQIAKAGPETDWAGLSRQFATGAEETRQLARELAALQRSDDRDALLHAFELRQLEITLAFISKLSNQIAVLHEGMARVESELVQLQQ